MENDLKRIHLIQRLVERVNTEVFEMSYMLIANHLLRNFHRISEVTIEELCQEAYVSKSTIRRFCNSIGYQNFSELKHAQPEKDNKEIINLNLQEKIPQIMQSIFEIKEDVLRQMIEEIKNHDYIFILHSYDLYSVFYDFQKEMLYQSKVVHLMPNIDLHYKDTKDFLDRSLIIIVDFDDYVYMNAKKYLNGLHSKNIYLTNHKNDYIQSSLTIEFEKYDSRVLKKYQLMYFFDRLMQLYS